MKRLVLPLVLLATVSLGAQVSFDRLLQADREPQNWLTYSGTYLGQRYSQLAQITPDNVKALELQWVFQAKQRREVRSHGPGGRRRHVHGAGAQRHRGARRRHRPHVLAVLVSAGAREPAPAAAASIGVWQSLATRSSWGTIEGHLVAVDAKTGSLIWDTAVAKPEAGYSLTHAPLVVKDKVIVGTAGGEYGIRGFLAAYDAKTGKEAWRFNTIPGPGEPGHDTWAGDSWKRGGGPIWVTGSYDRDLNLTYWGVGNPGPDFNGDVRLGDNLYTDSVIALDADTGQLKWHYQFSPHDEFDYDATQVPVLTDLSWNGRPRKVLMFGNRNGIFYVLDAPPASSCWGSPSSR
jgi:alcohol dehydrogenase (cytochrome c)